MLVLSTYFFFSLRRSCSWKTFSFPHKRTREKEKKFQIKTVRLFYEAKAMKRVHELRHGARLKVHLRLHDLEKKRLKFINFLRRKINLLWTFSPIIEEIVGNLLNVLTQEKLKRNELNIIRKRNIHRVLNLSHFPFFSKFSVSRKKLSRGTLFLH